MCWFFWEIYCMCFRKLGRPKTVIFPLNALIHWEVFSNFGASQTKNGPYHLFKQLEIPGRSCESSFPIKPRNRNMPHIQERTAYPLESLPEMVRSTHFIPGYIYIYVIILYNYIYYIYICIYIIYTDYCHAASFRSGGAKVIAILTVWPSCWSFVPKFLGRHMKSCWEISSSLV